MCRTALPSGSCVSEQVMSPLPASSASAAPSARLLAAIEILSGLTSREGVERIDVPSPSGVSIGSDDDVADTGTETGGHRPGPGLRQ